MTNLVVTYPATPGASFDAGYYVDTHLPLVREHWTGHGLTDVRVLLADGDQPYAAIAILDFRDTAALDAALGSAEAATVFGDVPNFTDIQPVAMRCR